MFRKKNQHVLLLCILTSLFISNFSNAQSVEPQIQINEFHKFRIAIDGGLGYLVASASEAKAQMKGFGISDNETDRYYRELKLGEQAGGSIYYQFNQNMGVGIDYNLFTTKSSVNGFLDPGDGWSKYYGPFSEKIYINFVGVSFLQTQKLNEKWNVYGKLSTGMAFYRDETRIITAPVLITGNAPAIKGESGISYALTRNISVNLGISYFFSVLNKIEMNNGTDTNELELEGDMKENLSRLSLTSGIQFHF